MIINKHEAASTKVALQDIAQNFGDAVFIISNTRLEGRNVVYFATDSASSPDSQDAPIPLESTAPIEPGKRITDFPGRTARKKPAARNTNRGEIIPQAPALQPAVPAMTDVASLEQKLEILNGMLMETAASMSHTETVVVNRLDSVELLQRKQKSGIDQLNRRMARQTELLSAILASMETRSAQTIPKFPEHITGTINAATEKPGFSGYTIEKSPAHLLSYMRCNGSFFESTAFSTGVHAILTDAATGNIKSMEAFCGLLGESARISPPCLIWFSPEKTAAMPASTFTSIATDKELENFLTKERRKRPIVIFISTRDYLNHVRAVKCLTDVKIHCYYSHGTALEQLAFLDEVHGLRPQSLSVVDVPRPTPGLPELFCLVRGGLPLLFLGTDKGSLSTPEATLLGYFGNNTGIKPATLIKRVLRRISLAATLNNSCTNLLRKLAGRVLHKMEPTNAK
jgi:hypothetical protein